ncbi:MAG TPA: CHASE3 domain-containing protein [Longimicrobium sp.]|jgi:signal transduction histidine kinase|nr:CHASE3 domain-containing protein [Longimicrobium sp.]
MPPGLQPIRLSPWRRFAAVWVPALLVLGFGAAGFWGTQRERLSRAAVDESHRTIERLQQVLATAVDAETGQRGYLLTGDVQYLAPFRRAKQDVEHELGELRRLTANDGPTTAARVDSLTFRIGRKFDELGETIDLRQAGDQRAALLVVSSGRGKATMDQARRLAAVLRAGEEAELRGRDDTETRNSVVLTALIVAGAAASAAVSLLLNRLLQRYGASQEAFAGELEAANHQLEEQQAELEQQNEQLQELTGELEAQSSQLQEQAAELTAQNDALHGLTSELETRTEAAEEANRAKSRFLAAMSHDLRTPLNAISGYADLIEMGIRGPVTGPQVADLQRIRNSSRHLLSLINGILSFARIEAGRVEVTPEPVPIGTLIRGIESSFLPQAREKRLRYTCDPGVEGLWVSADPEKAEQVLLNLVGNAIKFTPEGGEISVRCVDDGEHVAVQVRDTGRGIAPDELPTIFEPFVQVDREGVSERQRGVGLGLAISRELATAMGGDLSVQSELGKGSIFTLRLRRVPAPSPTAPGAAAGAGEPEPV